MDTAIVGQIEHDFLALPQAEQQTIISYGAALRLADLRKRLFLAKSKVRYFEDKYHTHLTDLDANGLPDDADVELHEDYIMWHHWAAVADQVKDDIAALQDNAPHHTHLTNFPHHKHLGSQGNPQLSFETTLDQVLAVALGD